MLLVSVVIIINDKGLCNKKPAPLTSAGFLFDCVLFSVEADQFSELHRLIPESTLRQ